MAVEANHRAFLDRPHRRRSRRKSCAQSARTPKRPEEETLDQLVARREAFLTDYQDAAYAARYRAMVDGARGGGPARLAGR